MKHANDQAAPQVLILPGWQGSGPAHWQSRWEALHGYARVEQHDWQQPRRGDWLARLDETVIDSERPVVLVAHSLGCILVAAWARFSRHSHQVRGALLVAPGDVEQPDLASALPGWAPILRDPLPFPSLLVASRDDPYCRFERAGQLGLTSKDQWKKQPQTMLVARATGELCRLVAADALSAVPYAAEEDDRPAVPVKATVTRVTAADILGEDVS